MAWHSRIWRDLTWHDMTMTWHLNMTSHDLNCMIWHDMTFTVRRQKSDIRIFICSHIHPTSTTPLPLFVFIEKNFYVRIQEVKMTSHMTWSMWSYPIYSWPSMAGPDQVRPKLDQPDRTPVQPEPDGTAGPIFLTRAPPCRLPSARARSTRCTTQSTTTTQCRSKWSSSAEYSGQQLKNDSFCLHCCRLCF